MSDSGASDTIALASAAATMEACDELLDTARRSIRIFAPDLDPHLLSRRPVIEALGRLVRVSRNTRIRVLFADGDSAIRSGHLLIAASRRFPSYITLRRLAEEHRDLRSSWIMADDRALLWRRDYARLEDAWISWQGGRNGQRLRRDFDDWWQYAETDPQFRQLHL